MAPGVAMIAVAILADACSHRRSLKYSADLQPKETSQVQVEIAPQQSSTSRLSSSVQRESSLRVE